MEGNFWGLLWEEIKFYWYRPLEWLLVLAFVLGVLVLGSYLQYRKGKKSDVEVLPAEIVKIKYETPSAPPWIWFQIEGEKKRRRFESRKGVVLHLPPIGTKGILTCRGPILYSFEWDDCKLVQDDPAYGKKGFSDLI